jgi:multicomponent Na+:H+ antiporter subunit G
MAMAAALMLVLGTALMMIAAIGLIRLRDPLQRMHSATKAGTLGTILLIAGVIAGMDNPPVSSGTLAILFLMVTLPLGAQMLGRATFRSEPDMVEGADTVIPGLHPQGEQSYRPAEQSHESNDI